MQHEKVYENTIQVKIVFLIDTGAEVFLLLWHVAKTLYIIEEPWLQANVKSKPLGYFSCTVIQVSVHFNVEV